MPKITQINRPMAQQLAKRIKEKLQELDEEFGYDISFDIDPHWRFSSSSLSVAVKASLDVPTEETSEGRTFALLAPRYDLQPDLLGKTFWMGNYEYRITGLKPSRPKYPVSAERVRDGRGYKFTVDQIKMGMRIGA